MAQSRLMRDFARRPAAASQSFLSSFNKGVRNRRRFVTKTLSSTTHSLTRKKKNHSLFSFLSVNSNEKRHQESESQQIQTPSERIVLLILATVGLVQLLSTFLQTYPETVRNTFVTNSYSSLILAFFFTQFFFLSAIKPLYLQHAYLATFTSLLLFLKLQQVIFNFSLMLPLFVIFVIITIVYNKSIQGNR